MSEVKLESLKSVLAKLKEFLGDAVIDWVDRETLKVVLERRNFEYEIVIKCKSDTACYKLRKVVSLVDLLTLF